MNGRVPGAPAPSEPRLPPKLLILDELSNHLILDRITVLEVALAAYDDAVLVVSHDDTFLKTLAPDRTIGLQG